ncbi:hypothetical protein [Kitasatospora sp. NPDC085464]|uniref:hypothetical protein n=1 Tax=Kitasatospora sp. NPDC085464 TaxID=3364063 RepID=UPI0037CB784B
MSLTDRLDTLTVERALRTLADLQNAYGVRELDRDEVLSGPQYAAAERIAKALVTELEELADRTEEVRTAMDVVTTGYRVVIRFRDGRGVLVPRAEVLTATDVPTKGLLLDVNDLQDGEHITNVPARQVIGVHLERRPAATG